MSVRRGIPGADASGERNGRSKIGGRTLVLAVLACIFVLLMELTIDKHVETDVEHWFGFHAAFSLFACVVLLLLGKLLRRVIARSENYYDAR